MAVCAQAPAAQAHRIFVYSPAAVVENEQIEVAVVIVVHPAGSRAPHLLPFVTSPGNPGLLRDVGKRSIAIVVVEMVAGYTGDIDILPAVVVVIAYRLPHIVAIAGDTRLVGDIGESAVMIIVKQTVLVLVGFFPERWKGGAIGEIDIQVAVVVVVDQPDAGDHCLRLILVWGGAAIRGEIQLRVRGDILETNRTVARRGA